MNTKVIAFLVVLAFIVGSVIGYSIKKNPEPCPPDTVTPSLIIRDTIFKVKKDTIKIPIEKVRYFTKIDTVIINDTFEYDDTQVIPKRLDCVSFPLLLSDSSLIEVTECSTDGLPEDLTYDAKYIDKRERIRIIENTRIDTLKQSYKKLGFTIGPSAGVGIDINNIKQPVYFIGATLTYGWRF